MATDLSSQIADAATQPCSVTTDGVTVSTCNLKDMVEADQYLAAKAAAARKGRGLRFTRLRPPGAVTYCDSFQTGSCCR